MFSYFLSAQELLFNSLMKTQFHSFINHMLFLFNIQMIFSFCLQSWAILLEYDLVLIILGYFQRKIELFQYVVSYLVNFKKIFLIYSNYYSLLLSFSLTKTTSLHFLCLFPTFAIFFWLFKNLSINLLLKNFLLFTFQRHYLLCLFALVFLII